jgi:hypothetical protein
VIRDHLRRLLEDDAFEPFRISLVNGEHYDIFDLQTVVVEAATVIVLPHDQNWAIFSLDNVNSLTSLIADYQGEALEHTSPAPDQ